MQPTDLPQVKPGTQWWHTYASQWQNLFDLAMRLANLSVGPGLQLSSRGRLMTLRLTEDVRKPKPWYRRVAVQSISQTGLMVREVRYAGKPPTVGEYRWAGPEIDAYPAVGSELADFEPHEWGTETPTTETSILDAHRLDEDWFVSIPGGGSDQIRYVVALAVVGAKSLLCRAVKRFRVEYPPDSGFLLPWDHTWTVAGEEETLAVEPGLLGIDYNFHLEPTAPLEGPLSSTTSILPVIWMDGVWIVQQHTPWAMDAIFGNVPSGDCVT